MKSFFSYYGGKWRAAPLYPPPRYGTIIEPFAGAAGYATRYHDRKVILREIDPKIARCRRYLTRVKPGEVMRIPVGIRHVDEVHHLPQEARWFLGFWMNKGTSQPRLQMSSRSHVRPKSHWGEEIRARIACQVQHIRHWKIIERPYHSCPNQEATWFIDPPYQQGGSLYKYGEVDYRHLADWVPTRFGQQIACESSGADWLPFEPMAKVKKNNYKGKGSYVEEVVYIGERKLEWTND